MASLESIDTGVVVNIEEIYKFTEDCEIVNDAGGKWILLNSKQGGKINGRILTGNDMVALNCGDLIEIDEFCFKFKTTANGQKVETKNNAEAIAEMMSVKENIFRELTRFQQLVNNLAAEPKNVPLEQESFKDGCPDKPELFNKASSTYLDLIANLEEVKKHLDEISAMSLSETPVKSVNIRYIEEMVENELECGICNEIIIKAVTLNCTHTFCEFCLRQWGKSNCPYCRIEIVAKNRCLVIDNFIATLTEKATSDAFRKIREKVLEERTQNEAQILAPSAIQYKEAIDLGDSIISVSSDDQDAI